jgi:leucyl aminopeptidase
MPADPEYARALRSPIADLLSAPKGSDAGMIRAGLFVGHFAAGVPWAHLDISPASWAERDGDLGPEGATGVIVPTLVRLAL